MPRLIKQILSNQVYEIQMRTLYGLPFRTLETVKAVMEGIVARVQIDEKVILSNFLWMANHSHMIVVSKDQEQFKDFYGQITKQITDAFKQFLNVEQLTLWKSNGVSAIRLKDKKTVIKQIAYIYANPAEADLVEKIEEYPGLSSWAEFNECLEGSIDSECVKYVPWIRSPMIGRLPDGRINEQKDAEICRQLKELAKKYKHRLVIKPNAWMKPLKIPEAEVAKTNRKILKQIREFEEKARKLRQAEGKRVMGAFQLKTEKLNMTYRPKNKENERTIAVYSVIKEVRIKMIEDYEAFRDQCAKCYERWKIGDYTVVWPPGAFLPAMPHRYNCIQYD